MYQALYRKYRPRTFSEVVGQSHITDTLQRQVAEGRVGHAYLFTGTRGTGKTTCARILAKAINCLHPVDGAGGGAAHRHGRGAVHGHPRRLDAAGIAPRQKTVAKRPVL